MANKSKRTGVRSALRDFLANEAAGGILLMFAAAAAMIVANSPMHEGYHHFFHELEGWTLSEKLGPMTPHLWINDGLMAIFFLLVGLEIKREFVDGRLSSWDRRRLPVLAAAAGMIVPALIYVGVVAGANGDPSLYNGWAIPAATDIAFAIGVLALLGKRAPASLKLFLVTVAIVDDMGAVAIIAIFYTAKLNYLALGLAALVLAAMYTLNRLRVLSLLPYLILAAVLWYVVLISGVHATIAGVLAAMMIPLVRTPGAPDAEDSPLHRLEHGIAPWSSYLIVPLFGFANAGVYLGGMGMDEVLAPLPLGIALGLFLGKQFGIFSAIWIACKTGFAGKPGGASWLQIYAVAMLCGIGFTMSLFIGELAFKGSTMLIDEAKIGVLSGSLLSAIIGFLILRFAPQDKHLKSLDEEDAKELVQKLSKREVEKLDNDLPGVPRF